MKKSNSLISIIMNCKNGQKYLEESIKSIINQNYQKWELIFYNNCSNDNSLEIVRSFKEQRIKVYNSKKNLSLYDARNKAIRCVHALWSTWVIIIAVQGFGLQVATAALYRVGVVQAFQ